MKQDKLIWFGIVTSTFIYAALAYVLAPNPQGTFSEAFRRSELTLVLYMVALASFAGANLIPKLLKSPDRTKMIVSLALYESCAIYGLVAAMISHDWRLYIPTWVAALIGMMRVYPSEDIRMAV